MGARPPSWTMTEAAGLLSEPQHRLIYLCEKGVVHPDIQDAEGRGSSRRFSTRNLLELAVALRLRDLEIRASLVAAVVHVLRSFESSVTSVLQGFRLPESLRGEDAPDLRVVISDGQRLYFVLRGKGGASRLFGGVDISRARAAKRVRAINEVPGARGEDGFGGPEGSRHVRVEVSVTRIAQDLTIPAEAA